MLFHCSCELLLHGLLRLPWRGRCYFRPPRVSRKSALPNAHKHDADQGQGDRPDRWRYGYVDGCRYGSVALIGGQLVLASVCDRQLPAPAAPTPGEQLAHLLPTVRAAWTRRGRPAIGRPAHP
ncbi:hypothetical protein XAP6984_1460001 [Xanthomonas phaseoli pv. phaseoli]|uniref:Uncharacterized protein n=1 Tax=Xanthomonas campestris pv. phaseoli TaxID=317013 RepID=A0ABY1TPM7_XANCH|nr:hypothetical protein XAP6984_1460001 [Xanthomonas phaseoli pv. phaseoli]